MTRFLGNIPIALKVSAILTIAVIAMLCLLQHSAGRHLSQTMSTLVEDRLRATAVARAATIEAGLMRQRATLRHVADRQELLRALEVLRQSLTVGEARADPRVLSGARATLAGIATDLELDILVVDSHGRILFASDPGQSGDGTVFDRSEGGGSHARAALQVLRGAGFSTDALVVPMTIDERSIFHFGMPIYDARGDMVGVLVAGVPAMRIGPMRSVDRATETRVSLKNTLRLSGPAPVGSGLQEVSGGMASTFRHVHRFDVQGAQLAVDVSQPSAFLRAPVTQLRQAVFVDGLLALVFVAAGGLLLARTVSRPLADLGRTIDNVANGIYNDPIRHLGRRDEVGQISRQLDRMRAALADAEAVARDNSFRSAALERASAALILADRSLTILHTNAAFRSLLAAHRIALSRVVSEFAELSPVGRNVVILNRSAPQAAQKIIDGDAEHICNEIRVGRLRFMFDQGPVRDRNGAVIGFAIEVRDVTQAYADAARLRAFDASCAVAEFLPNRRLHNSNALFAAFFDVDPSDLVGESLDQLLTWTGADPWRHDSECPRGPLVRPMLTGNARLRGAEDWHEAVVYRECDAGGRLSAVTVVLPGGRLAAAGRRSTAVPNLLETPLR